MKKVILLILLLLTKECLANSISNFDFAVNHIERDVDSEITKVFSSKNKILNLYGQNEVGRKGVVQNYLKKQHSKYDVIWRIRSNHFVKDILKLLFYLDQDLAKDSIVSENEKLIELLNILTSKHSWFLVIEEVSDLDLIRKYLPAFNLNKTAHICFLSQNRIKGLNAVKISTLSQRETKVFFEKYKFRVSKNVTERLLDITQRRVGGLISFYDIYKQQYRLDGAVFEKDINKIEESYYDDGLIKFLIEFHPKKMKKFEELYKISRAHPYEVIKEAGLYEFVKNNNLGVCLKNECELRKSKFISKPQKVVNYHVLNYLNKMVRSYDPETEIQPQNIPSDYILYFLSIYPQEFRKLTKYEGLLYELLSYIVYEKRNWALAKGFFENNKRLFAKHKSHEEIGRSIPVFVFGYSQLESNSERALEILELYEVKNQEEGMYIEYSIQRAQVLLEMGRYEEAEIILEKLRGKKITNKFRITEITYLNALYYYHIEYYEKAKYYIDKLENLEWLEFSVPMEVLRERIYINFPEESDKKLLDLVRRLNSKTKYKNYKPYILISKAILARKYIKRGKQRQGLREILRLDNGSIQEDIFYEDYFYEYLQTKALAYKYNNQNHHAKHTWLSILDIINKKGCKKHKYYRECYYNLALLASKEKRGLDYVYYTKKLLNSTLHTSRDYRISELINLDLRNLD